MAPKKNPEAVKAAKQKKMLIGLGVLLAAVGAFQGPKLLGGGSKPATEAASTSTTADAAQTAGGATSSTPTATPTSEALPPPEPPAPLLPGEAGKKAPTATLVGVRIATGSTVRATEGQLASFSLFTPKDPFKPQQVEAEPETPAAAPEPPKETGAKSPTPSTPPPPAANGPTAPVPPAVPIAPVADPAAPVVPPTFATVSVNGAAESLELGAVFPELSKLFVLAKVKPKGVEIGIAGGRLEHGPTAQVKVGKPITLVDSASGVRYTIEILSVGTQPDLEFTTAGKPALTGASAPAASTPTP